jgi:PKD repeat protein
MMRARGALLGVLVAVACFGCSGGGTESTPSTASPAATATTIAPAKGQASNADPLLVWADCDEDEGDAPLHVKFLADIEGGTPPLKYAWTFGDGTADSKEPNPQHVYEKAGYYQAELIVTDSGGDEDSDFLEIEVTGDEDEDDGGNAAENAPPKTAPSTPPKASQ